MSQSNDDGLPFNPDELPCPADCVAKPTDVQVSVEDSVDPADECLVTLAEHLQAPYQPEPEVMVIDPKDGLPTPVDAYSLDQSLAPPFNHAYVNCIADARTYVSLFYDELPEIDRGRFCVERDRYDREGKEKPRREFKPAEVTIWRGYAVVVVPDGRVPVRPVRPACKYYARQLFVNSGQPDPKQPGHRLRMSFCAHPARRSIGGAALSLQNEAIFACDLRDPPDPASLARELDAFDARALEQDATKTLVPLFNLKD
jgi:hypothetical protein